MKTLNILLNGLLLIIAMAIMVACSKNDESPPGNENLKNSGIGEKQFTGTSSPKQFSWGNFNHMFTNNEGISHFAQNQGNNFANNTPGGGGGLPVTGSGNMVANGTNIPLVFGGFVNYGDYYFDLILLNQVISIDGESYPGLSGIIFEIISPSSEEIIPGNYHYSEDGDFFTFDYATVGINTETPNEVILEVITGYCNISKTDDTYAIEFSGKLENQASYSGNYNGILVNLDEGTEPPGPESTLSATIDGTAWSTTDVYGYSDGLTVISISGSAIGSDKYLSMDLNYDQVQAGAQLSLDNGGVYSIIYGSGSSYYAATDVANVSITSYNGNIIYGSFNFIGEDFSGNSITVTNGSFQNVEIIIGK
ncbi:MAG: hypothetical protein KQI35_16090 [Bacteroidetes bacterium]|nr:hypothetical protein [Bacteroidota bacterium]